MKIVILGAGKVGLSIIENFIDEESDIVVVDEDQSKLDDISVKYDLLTIQGSATDLETLDHAGLKSANLVIAVTNNDEINIIACKIANDVYNVQYKIARLRKAVYLNNKDKLFTDNIFPIDYVIEPTMIMARSIYNLIKFPGVETFTYFGDNQNIGVYSCEAQYGGIYVGKPATNANSELLNLNISLVSIIRNNSIIKINEDTIINAGDKIIMCSDPENVMLALSHFQRPLNKPRHIMLAGGSKINYYLANMLSDQASVKIIEKNIEKASALSNEMSNCLIIEGDCTDENLLFDERIDTTDLFVAATNQDNVNVLTSVLAKRLGSKRVISLIGKSINRSLIHNEEIDIIYSGQNDIATELRSKAKITNFSKIYKDPHSNFQIGDFKIKENFKDLEVLNRRYKDIQLPSGIFFVGLIRNDNFMVVKESTVFEKNDRVLVICQEASHMEEFIALNSKPADMV